MYLFISLFSCVEFPFPQRTNGENNCSETPTTRMKEDKEELKEEGEENNESFIGALIAKFRERDDSGDDDAMPLPSSSRKKMHFSKQRRLS